MASRRLPTPGARIGLARKVFAGQWPILLVGIFLVAAFGLVAFG